MRRCWWLNHCKYIILIDHLGSQGHKFLCLKESTVLTRNNKIIKMFFSYFKRIGSSIGTFFTSYPKKIVLYLEMELVEGDIVPLYQKFNIKEACSKFKQRGDFETIFSSGELGEANDSDHFYRFVY
jgi:hypothetical protein